MWCTTMPSTYSDSLISNRRACSGTSLVTSKATDARSTRWSISVSSVTR
ncbi:Uncharacterised protein [Mycobacteroides abscessus subsp. abscessus]|nr:Uncharacterised protein [Mycobacteroides abscessus subsp. abscessus]